MLTKEQIEIIAQIIGIFGLIANSVAYQMRGKNAILFFQMLGSAIFTVNYILIGAYSGAILNAVAIIRAIVYIYKDKFKAGHIAWLMGFSTIYVLSYVAVFTILGKEPTANNLILEVLPVVAMIVVTISYRSKSAKTVRALGMINSPLWLIYNIANVAIGAIISGIINIVSIVIGIIRYDIRKTPAKEEEAKAENEN